MRFAFYGRVSTEDAQDPIASRAWQLRRSSELIAPAGGRVVAEYFDIGQSRSLPWKRRPEASRLLNDIADVQRGFEAVVIGEPARAFYGSQFALTFPLFTHYRVALWVPEVGGPVDPGSEAHDLVMNLFGGLSKGERMRIQIRVRAAMESLAAEGERFLGGRPPYGYQLVDAGPHPNPQKATAGQRLHRLEPDPVTAPVVRRIFKAYARGDGLRLIADQLTAEEVPSPAAYDRQRNPHRDPRGWSHAAIRAILVNPIYGGRRYWGKQRRDEELLDVHDVSAGNVTRMRWRPHEQWIEASSSTVKAIVNEVDVAAVAERFGGTARRTKQRDAVHPYLLRGVLYCGICGRRMQGSARRARSGHGHTRVLYRCELGKTRSIPVDMDHPPTVHAREDAIVPRLDAWLAEIVTPEALAAAQAPTPGDTAQDAAIRAKVADCDSRLGRLLESLEHGIDPEVVAPRIQELQRERERLQAQVRHQRQTRPMTAREIGQWADQLGGLVTILGRAEPEQRAEIYADLGVRLSYHPGSPDDGIVPRIEAQAELARVGRGVGGGA